MAAGLSRNATFGKQDCITITRLNIPYQLHNRSHNITLINKTKFLNDTDFIIRMLYKYSY